MARPKLQSLTIATIRCLLALCVFGLFIGPQVLAQRASERVAMEVAQQNGHARTITLRKGTKSSFGIKGRVRGLYPGARKPLRVRLINHHRFPIKVRSVRIRVLKGNHVGCGRRWIRPKRVINISVKVPGKSRAFASYPVRMRKAAPQACSGAKWKLRFSGTGKRP